MNIDINKIIVNNKMYFQIVKFKPCCNNILGGEFNEIGYPKDRLNEDLIKVIMTYGNCFLGLNIKMESSFQQRNDYILNSCYKKINYCPFCGEPININILNIMDRTKDYNNLIRKRNELEYQYELTNKIQEDIRYINEKINKLLYSNDIYKFINILNEERK